MHIMMAGKGRITYGEMPAMLVLIESHQIDTLFGPALRDGHDLVRKEGKPAGFGDVG